jgi:hypothetical protein
MTLATLEQAFPESPNEVAGSLQSSLADGGLEQPQILSGILQEMGLSSVQDVQLLNVPEQLELAESLREQGVNLGSRCKLRLLSEESNEAADLLDTYFGCRSNDGGPLSTNTGISHRQTQDQAAVSKTESKDDGPSFETLAIVLTALLSVGSYILQTKLAQVRLKSHHFKSQAGE